MRKPTFVGVGLLFLATHCGGSEHGAPQDTPKSSGGSATGGSATGGSVTGGSVAAPASGNGTGGTTTTPTPTSGTGGSEATENNAGSAVVEGGAGGSPSVDGGGPDTGAAGGTPTTYSTVSGYVVGNWDQPLEGVLIAIDGVATTTDAEGAFRIANVAPRYRAIVLQSEERRAQIFEGLTARHPTFLGESPTPSASTTMSGTVVNADGSMIATEHRGIAAFTANGAQRAKASARLFGGGNYSLGVDWLGGSLVGTLSALAWSTDEEGLPKVYDGYAKTPAILMDSTGGNRAAITGRLALERVATRALQGTITLSPDYAASLEYHVGPLVPLSIPKAKVGTAFTYRVPGTTGELSWVSVEATRPLPTGVEFSAIRRVVSDWSAPLDLTVPKAPSLVMPVDDAAAINPSATFQWISPESAVSVVRFEVADFSVEVSTTQTSMTLPDLSAFGISFPAGSQGTWEVHTLPGVQSVDDAARFAYSTQEFLGTEGAADLSRSVQRSFDLAN